MMRSIQKQIILSLLILGTLAIVGCAPPQDPLPEVQKASLTSVVKTNNTFSINLFKQIIEKKKNTFLSPYSVATALSMLSAGAKGETKKEILKALSYGISENEMHKANAWLMIDLNNRGRLGNFELSVVNRLWGQQNFSFSKDFLKLLKDNYLAELQFVNFQGDSQKARQQINQWVENQTKGKIKDLMPADAITSDTRLVLANAIYFKGEWLNKFEEKNTSNNDFYLGGTDKVQVPMMHASEVSGKLLESNDLKLLSLPYKGKEISMVIIMPNKKESLDDFISKKLSDSALKGWLQKAGEIKEIQVSLPKFKLEQKYDLKKTLQKLGIKSVFNQALADLSGIDNGKKSLYLAYAVHKAFIEVNEEGTEAAGATGLGVNLKAAIPEHTFKADHPFLFMIYDNKTESILFMGKLYNPTK